MPIYLAAAVSHCLYRLPPAHAYLPGCCRESLSLSPATHSCISTWLLPWVTVFIACHPLMPIYLAAAVSHCLYRLPPAHAYLPGCCRESLSLSPATHSCLSTWLLPWVTVFIACHPLMPIYLAAAVSHCLYRLPPAHAYLPGCCRESLSLSPATRSCISTWLLPWVTVFIACHPLMPIYLAAAVSHCLYRLPPAHAYLPGCCRESLSLSPATHSCLSTWLLPWVTVFIACHPLMPIYLAAAVSHCLYRLPPTHAYLPGHCRESLSLSLATHSCLSTWPLPWVTVFIACHPLMPIYLAAAVSHCLYRLPPTHAYLPGCCRESLSLSPATHSCLSTWPLPWVSVFIACHPLMPIYLAAAVSHCLYRLPPTHAYLPGRCRESLSLSPATHSCLSTWLLPWVSVFIACHPLMPIYLAVAVSHCLYRLPPTLAYLPGRCRESLSLSPATHSCLSTWPLPWVTVFIACHPLMPIYLAAAVSHCLYRLPPAHAYLPGCCRESLSLSPATHSCLSTWLLPWVTVFIACQPLMPIYLAAVVSHCFYHLPPAHAYLPGCCRESLPLSPATRSCLSTWLLPWVTVFIACHLLMPIYLAAVVSHCLYHLPPTHAYLPGRCRESLSLSPATHSCLSTWPLPWVTVFIACHPLMPIYLAAALSHCLYRLPPTHAYLPGRCRESLSLSPATHSCLSTWPLPWVTVFIACHPLMPIYLAAAVSHCLYRLPPTLAYYLAAAVSHCLYRLPPTHASLPGCCHESLSLSPATHSCLSTWPLPWVTVFIACHPLMPIYLAAAVSHCLYRLPPTHAYLPGRCRESLSLSPATHSCLSTWPLPWVTVFIACHPLMPIYLAAAVSQCLYRLPPTHAHLLGRCRESLSLSPATHSCLSTWPLPWVTVFIACHPLMPIYLAAAVSHCLYRQPPTHAYLPGRCHESLSLSPATLSFHFWDHKELYCVDDVLSEVSVVVDCAVPREWSAGDRVWDVHGSQSAVQHPSGSTPGAADHTGWRPLRPVSTGRTGKWGSHALRTVSTLKNMACVIMCVCMCVCVCVCVCDCTWIISNWVFVVIIEIYSLISQNSCSLASQRVLSQN